MNTPEQQVRQALSHVPEVPVAPGYGARIARRARRSQLRRRVWTVSGGTVAVLAVVFVAILPGPWRNGSGEGPGVASPSPDPTALVAPGPLVCSQGQEQALPPRESDSVVPGDVVAARLCGTNVDNGGFDSVWPADTLTGDYAQRLVRRINMMRPYVEQDYCDQVGGQGFTVVLQYPDGTRLGLEGYTAGNCATLDVPGGAQYRNPAPILGLALNLVREQRAASGPSGETAPVRCLGRYQDLYATAGATPLTANSAVAMTACRYRLDLDPRFIDQSADGPLRQETAIEDPSLLMQEIAAGGLADPCGGVAYDLDPVQDVLVITDASGDVHAVPVNAPCWPTDVEGERRYPTNKLALAVAAALNATA